MTSLKNFDVYDCFFSGGRDSALTCYIAKKVGDSLNIPTRLIHELIIEYFSCQGSCMMLE